MTVHPGSDYARLAGVEGPWVRADRQLRGHIKKSCLASGGVYGYRKVHDDLRAFC